jgi:Predicted hydrolases or acyltransferases (alpha/beta hydrolase superfamily)
MPIVKVNGIELYYEKYGFGDEVVLSAQQRFSEDAYPVKLAERPAEYTVYNVTLRGYGQSTHLFEAPAKGWYPTWAEDIYAFSRAMNLDSFIYTGVSHGAGVGWQLVSDFPDAVKAFISVVGAPHPRERIGGVTSKAMQRMNESAHKPEALDADDFPFYLVPTTDERRLLRRAQLKQEFQERLTSFSPEERAIHPGVIFPEARTEEELVAILSGIKVPTLLLCGMFDELSTAETAFVAAKAIPKSKAVFYQDHSHTLASEAPERLISEVTRFIDEVNQGLV